MHPARRTCTACPTSRKWLDLQGWVYCSSQLSDFSSAAATHTCPKLSQYLSQRPLYGAVSTSAMQSAHVTPLSTFGQVSKELQHPLLTA